MASDMKDVFKGLLEAMAVRQAMQQQTQRSPAAAISRQPQRPVPNLSPRGTELLQAIIGKNPRLQPTQGEGVPPSRADMIAQQGPAMAGGAGAGGIAGGMLQGDPRVLNQEVIPTEAVPVDPPPAPYNVPGMPADIAAGHNLPSMDPRVISQMYGDTRMQTQTPVGMGRPTIAGDNTLNASSEIAMLEGYLADKNYSVPPPGSDVTTDEWNRASTGERENYVLFRLNELQDPLRQQEAEIQANRDTMISEAEAATPVLDVGSVLPNAPSMGEAISSTLDAAGQVTPDAIPEKIGWIVDKAIDWSSIPIEKRREVEAEIMYYMATHNGEMPWWATLYKDPFFDRSDDSSQPSLEQVKNQVGGTGTGIQADKTQSWFGPSWLEQNQQYLPVVAKIYEDAEAARAAYEANQGAVDSTGMTQEGTPEGPPPTGEEAVWEWFAGRQTELAKLGENIGGDPLNMALALGIPAKGLKGAAAAKTIQGSEGTGRILNAAGETLRFASDPFSYPVERLWDGAKWTTRHLPGSNLGDSATREITEGDIADADILSSSDEYAESTFMRDKDAKAQAEQAKRDVEQAKADAKAEEAAQKELQNQITAGDKARAKAQADAEKAARKAESDAARADAQAEKAAEKELRDEIAASNKAQADADKAARKAESDAAKADAQAEKAAQKELKDQIDAANKRVREAAETAKAKTQYANMWEERKNKSLAKQGNVQQKFDDAIKSKKAKEEAAAAAREEADAQAELDRLIEQSNAAAMPSTLPLEAAPVRVPDNVEVTPIPRPDDGQMPLSTSVDNAVDNVAPEIDVTSTSTLPNLRPPGYTDPESMGLFKPGLTKAGEPNFAQRIIDDTTLDPGAKQYFIDEYENISREFIQKHPNGSKWNNPKSVYDEVVRKIEVEIAYQNAFGKVPSTGFVDHSWAARQANNESGALERAVFGNDADSAAGFAQLEQRINDGTNKFVNSKVISNLKAARQKRLELLGEASPAPTPTPTTRSSGYEVVDELDAPGVQFVRRPADGKIAAAPERFKNSPVSRDSMVNTYPESEWKTLDEWRAELGADAPSPASAGPDPWDTPTGSTTSTSMSDFVSEVSAKKRDFEGRRTTKGIKTRPEQQEIEDAYYGVQLKIERLVGDKSLSPRWANLPTDLNTGKFDEIRKYLPEFLDELSRVEGRHASELRDYLATIAHGNPGFIPDYQKLVGDLPMRPENASSVIAKGDPHFEAPTRNTGPVTIRGEDRQLVNSRLDEIEAEIKTRGQGATEPGDYPFARNDAIPNPQDDLGYLIDHAIYGSADDYGLGKKGVPIKSNKLPGSSTRARDILYNRHGFSDLRERLKDLREKAFGKIDDFFNQPVGIINDPKATAKRMADKTHAVISAGGKMVDDFGKKLPTRSASPQYIYDIPNPPENIKFREDMERLIASDANITQADVDLMSKNYTLTKQNGISYEANYWDSLNDRFMKEVSAINKKLDSATMGRDQAKLVGEYNAALKKARIETLNEFKKLWTPPQRNMARKAAAAAMNKPRSWMMYNGVTGWNAAARDWIQTDIRMALNGNLGAVRYKPGFVKVIAREGTIDDIMALPAMDIPRKTGARPPSDMLLTGGKEQVDRTTSGTLWGKINPVENDIVKAIRGGQDYGSRFAIYLTHYGENLKYTQADFMKSVRRAQTKLGDDTLDQAILDLGPFFDANDVRRVLKSKGITDETLAREWASRIKKLSRESYERQRKVLFSYKKTKADEQLSKVFLFHYFMTRSSQQYVKLMMQHPQLIRMEAEMWDYSQNNLDDLPAPDWMKGYIGWMNDNGHAVFTNPMMLISGLTVFADVGDQGFHKSAVEGVLNATGLFLNPLIQAGLATVGLMSAPTSLYPRQLEKLIVGIGREIAETDWGREHNMREYTDEYAKDLVNSVIDYANEKARGVSSDIKDFEASTSQTLYEGRVLDTLEANFIEEFGEPETWTDEEENLYYETIKNFNNDIDDDRVNSAYAEVARLNSYSVGGNAVIPTGLAVTDADAQELNETQDAAFDVSQDERTPGEQATVDMSNLTESKSPQALDLTYNSGRYYELVEGLDQDLKDGVNQLVNETIPDGFGGTIGGVEYTSDQINAMTEDERFDLAEQWLEDQPSVTSRSGRVITAADRVQETKDAQQIIRAGSPELDDFLKYQKYAFGKKDDPGGLRQYRNEMLAVPGDNEFKRAHDRKRASLESSGLEGEALEVEMDDWMTGQQAYAAMMGWQWRSNLDPGAALYHGVQVPPWREEAESAVTSTQSTGSKPSSTGKPSTKMPHRSTQYQFNKFLWDQPGAKGNTGNPFSDWLSE